MINSTTGPLSQIVDPKSAILFNVDRVRSRRCDRGCGGWLFHDVGSGLFQLVNDRQCKAVFEVQFNANVGPDSTGENGGDSSSSTAGASGSDMSLAIMLNGEAIGGTEMKTNSASGTLENISASTLVVVPHGASVTITVDNIGPSAALVEDGNIIISKVA